MYKVFTVKVPKKSLAVMLCGCVEVGFVCINNFDDLPLLFRFIWLCLHSELLTGFLEILMTRLGCSF